jgi:hypothetical protein
VVLPFAYMRFPEKYMMVLVGWLGLLAALGVMRMLSGERQPWRRVAVFLGLLLLLAASAPWFFPGRWAAQVTRGALTASVAVASILAVQALAARRLPLTQFLLIAVVAVDLAAATWPLQAFSPRAMAQASAPALPAVLADSHGHGEPPRLYRVDSVLKYAAKFTPPPPPGLGESWLLQTFITNTANNWGIATLPGYDAAIPTGINQIWRSGLSEGQSVLRLFGASYALLPVEDPRPSQEKRTGIDPLLDPLPGTRLYRIPGTLPRVFPVGQAQVLDDATALRRIFDPAIIAGGTAWLAPESEARPLLDASNSSPGTCALHSYSNNRLQAHCQLEKPALAVFVEQFAEGWHATVDGQPAPILRANLVMRALALGPGSHTIEMEYTTPGLRWGAIISLLSLAALLVLGFSFRAAQRRSGRRAVG